MTRRENITDILCIGCQKGSTSWLHSVVNCHPGTAAFPDREPQTSTDKEAHFWDWNHDRGVEWYRDLMAQDDPTLLTMDFTPEYAMMSDAQIAECKALNPSATVIYILRDPMVRAVSAIRMHMLWHLGKDHRDPLVMDDRFWLFFRDAMVVRHNHYLRNVRAWRAAYPDLVLLNYESFHNDRAASVSALFDRLGLDQSAITGASAERMARLMAGRIWVSEPFPIDRSVLMFLHGLTWRTRQETRDELGMTFGEFTQLLDG